MIMAIQYTVAEARGAATQNVMDEYHRGLINFLCDRVESLESEKNKADGSFDVCLRSEIITVKGTQAGIDTIIDTLNNKKSSASIEFVKFEDGTWVRVSDIKWIGDASTFDRPIEGN